jgi:hypothetical protein
MFVFAWTVGCGSPEPVRSAPTEPTVALAPPDAAQQGVVWSDLADVFPEEGPALPAPVAALVPGQPADAAIAVLEAGRHPAGPIRRSVLGGHPVHRALLRDRPDVSVSLVLDTSGATLHQVNLNLPEDQALAVLGDRWGTPEVTSGPSGTPVHRWTRDGAPWAAELQSAGEGRAILAFRAP